MNCTVCGKEMKLIGEDTSKNFDTHEQYDRKIYHCESDDVWIRVEIPKQKAD